jgi:thiamine biosynthesis lipoprotein
MFLYYGVFMKKRSRQFIIFVILSHVVIFSVILSRRKSVHVESGSIMVMGTVANVVAVAEDANTSGQCVKAVFEQLRGIDDLMSDYINDSEISTVNQNAASEPVKVSDATFEVLRRAIDFSKVSEGAFDITVGPLVDLWRSAAEANSTPSEEQLRQAREKVGYEKLILDPNEMTVRFAVKGMRLDLGGIAKGYAIDKAVEAMQKLGALGGMVDVGGDIRCFGRPPKKRDSWLIGLDDPRHPQDMLTAAEPLLVIKLNDTAIATSGDYQRFAWIEGKKYSHIYDRKTGYSSKDLTSVTIIANNATDADALATAVSVLGPEKGLELIESIPDTEAILISAKPDLKITKTKGADKLIKP